MSDTQRHAVVIGAGMGGLAAAITLAARGWRVTVIERLGRPGGKMGEVAADGYRWDTGPSVLTMRHVFEQLAQIAGRSLADYISLIPLSPITRYFWPDGARLDAVSDQDAMCDNIRQAGFDPHDVENYRAFMRHVAAIHGVIGQPFLYRARPTLRDLLRLPLPDVLKIDALRSMHAAVRAHFRDPHLIQLFDRFSTYNGSSPYLAPATLNVIAHVEMAGGAWYPRGGLYALAGAAAQLARDVGVEIVYNTAVAGIETQSRRVTGVRLMDGTHLAADAVICNMDFAHAQRTLLNSSAARPSKLDPSCSGYVLLLKSRAAHVAMAHHNLFFCEPEAYRAEFDEIFAQRLPPSRPTLYVCITSKTDIDHAPAGCENWFVLANVPYLTAAFDWERGEPEYREQVLTTLQQQLARHTPSFGPFEVHSAWTPQTIQDTYGGNLGAIYGFSSNSRMAAFMRPANRASGVHGLYYAGGSVHPGGGVPLVTVSGMAAAGCVLDDEKTRRR